MLSHRVYACLGKARLPDLHLLVHFHYFQDENPEKVDYPIAMGNWDFDMQLFCLRLFAGMSSSQGNFVKAVDFRKKWAT